MITMNKTPQISAADLKARPEATAALIFSEWNALTRKHQDFGADDTESDYHFQEVIRSVILGEPVNIPTTARQWELYNHKGVSSATREMTAFTRKVVRSLRGARGIDLAKLFCPELWRVF